MPKTQFFPSILHPHLIPIKLLKILHFQQFRSVKIVHYFSPYYGRCNNLVMPYFSRVFEFNSVIIVQFFCKIKGSGFYATSDFLCFIPYISMSPAASSTSVGVVSSVLTSFFNVEDFSSNNPCKI